MSKLVNVYAGLSNVESVMDYEPSEILAAIPRLFWPQYDLQIGMSNAFRLGRAWHVYATDEGKAAFSAKWGIDLEVFLKIGFMIYAGTEGQPAIRPGNFASVGITNAQLHKVRQIIGENFEGHYDWAKVTANADIPRDFLRSVTKERPIFEVSDPKGKVYLVPSRGNLMLRLTDGLYYDTVGNSDARRRSGEAFEELCLRMIRHYIGSDRLVESERETKYGRSADILIEDHVIAKGFIVECKVRRLPQRVLTSPKPFEDCSDAFDDIIKGIVQVWRTYHEIYGDAEMNMVGIVLQYDPWAVMGNAFVHKIFEAAHEKADGLSIPKSDRIPVALVGYSDFDRLLRNYRYSDIFDAACDWSEESFQGWELYGVLQDKAKEREPKLAFDYGELIETTVSWWPRH